MLTTKHNLTLPPPFVNKITDFFVNFLCLTVVPAFGMTGTACSCHMHVKADTGNGFDGVYTKVYCTRLCFSLFLVRELTKCVFLFLAFGISVLRMMYDNYTVWFEIGSAGVSLSDISVLRRRAQTPLSRLKPHARWKCLRG